MATYKKRGYKPQNKAEKEVEVLEDSTTAEVFNTLDESASKTEAWVSKNQNIILGFIGVVALGILGYLAFDQFVQKPKESEASNELYYPQRFFDDAMQNTEQKDSLLTLALNGADGKFGFLDIINEYSGTKAANLAKYSAGMAYLNQQKYQEAITYLEEFSSDDEILGALAKGGIGDAFSQLEQPGEAMEYYKKAIAHSSNDFTTPKFLYKAGILAMNSGEKAKAAEFFERIKEDFPKSSQANDIDVLLGMAKN